MDSYFISNQGDLWEFGNHGEVFKREIGYKLDSRNDIVWIDSDKSEHGSRYALTIEGYLFSLDDLDVVNEDYHFEQLLSVSFSNSDDNDQIEEDYEYAVRHSNNAMLGLTINQDLVLIQFNTTDEIIYTITKISEGIAYIIRTDILNECTVITEDSKWLEIDILHRLEVEFIPREEHPNLDEIVKVKINDGCIITTSGIFSISLMRYVVELEDVVDIAIIKVMEYGPSRILSITGDGNVFLNEKPPKNFIFKILADRSPFTQFVRLPGGALSYIVNSLGEVFLVRRDTSLLGVGLPVEMFRRPTLMKSSRSRI